MSSAAAGGTLHLYDRNFMRVRQITFSEAAQLVLSGDAEPIVPGGWRDRPDVPWEGVQLVMPRRTTYTPTSLTQLDAEGISGLLGDTGRAHEARLRVKFWCCEHDTKAPLVVPHGQGTKSYVPDAKRPACPSN